MTQEEDKKEEEKKKRRLGSKKENRETRRLRAKRNAAKKRGDEIAEQRYIDKLNKEYQEDLKLEGHLYTHIPYRTPKCASHRLDLGEKCPKCGFVQTKP